MSCLHQFPWRDFQLFCNAKREKFDKVLDGFSLLAGAVALSRHWSTCTLADLGHIALHLSLVILGAVLRARDQRRYQQLRPVLAPLLRITIVTGPGTWKITALALQGSLPAQPPARLVLHGLAVLLFSSAVVTNCVAALGRSVLLPIHVATQAAVVAVLLQSRGEVCSMPVFQSEPAQQMLDFWWRHFALVSLALPLPFRWQVPPQATPLLCSQVLGVLQVWVGFLAPVVAAALLESSWFGEFQGQMQWAVRVRARSRHLREQARTGTPVASNGHTPHETMNIAPEMHQEPVARERGPFPPQHSQHGGREALVQGAVLSQRGAVGGIPGALPQA